MTQSPDQYWDQVGPRQHPCCWKRDGWCKDVVFCSVDDDASLFDEWEDEEDLDVWHRDGDDSDCALEEDGSNDSGAATTATTTAATTVRTTAMRTTTKGAVAMRTSARTATATRIGRDATMDPMLNDKVPRGWSTAHPLFLEKKIVYLSFDIETGGKECGIIQMSSELIRFDLHGNRPQHRN